MKITNVEKKENSTIELSIQVEGEVFQTAVQKAYTKNRGRINVPGFRKGKAPRKIIEKMYGSGIFFDDAVNECYPKAYEEALAQENIEEVGYPKIQIKEVNDDGFTFLAIVTVKPEVKISQYKGLQAPKDVEPVTDDDIEKELKPFVQRATRVVSVERAVKEGDTAVIDFEGFDQGVAFKGGKGENYSLEIGSGSFIPGFEDQVIGMNKGDEKEINVTFPENYAPDLAGKDVVFKVKVNEVKEPQKPVVDDEFAKDVSEFDTLAEFKDSLRKNLEEKRTELAEQDYEDAILMQLVDNMEGVVPDAMVAMQIDKLLEDNGRRMASQGISMEQFQRMIGGDMNRYRSSLAPTALQQVKSQLALGAVADAEDFQISDEELIAEVKQLAIDYNITEEQVKSAVPEPTMRSDLRLKKAAELVISEAKIGPAPERKEAEASGEDEAKTTKKRATKKADDGEATKKRTTRKKKTDEE